jgi:hypothetical protein
MKFGCVASPSVMLDSVGVSVEIVSGIVGSIGGGSSGNS